MYIYIFFFMYICTAKLLTHRIPLVPSRLLLCGLHS